ncbi:MAG TPA: hypothetical protein VFW28_10745 [Micropepsaceae bacterium]|nr:hypothetical protein [Micropepsaceae bacterium]
MRLSLVLGIALSFTAATAASAQTDSWRITRTEWTAADEKGFGEFIAAIARSGCTSTVACMRSAANYYHESDPGSFEFHADCAKWVYMLRAYYASKNGLPFSYVSHIRGDGDDLRFTKTSNEALARRDIIDTGDGIATVPVLKLLHNEVWTATYRMNPVDETPVEQDFYSPKIQPGSIRPGTAIYDINGHVGLVYDIAPDGRILYMDAYPDEHVSRSAYGLQFGQSPAELGGGFKNFRPLKLAGATKTEDGDYIGGTVVLATNAEIPDYSLEQYRGNIANANADGPGARFVYNGIRLGLFEYARASMSNGGFAFNPVYELKASMVSICHDAREQTASALVHAQSTLSTLRHDLSEMIALWEKRDLRIVYDGRSLKETLWSIYSDGVQACTMRNPGQGQALLTSLDQFAARSPSTDIRGLITDMSETAPFAGMRPVGY